MKKKEYLVVSIEEGFWGTLILGSSKIPVRKMNDVLNKMGECGWSVDFQIIEKKRMLLFWQRECVIITLSRELNSGRPEEG